MAQDLRTGTHERYPFLQAKTSLQVISGLGPGTTGEDLQVSVITKLICFSLRVRAISALTSSSFAAVF